MRRKIVIAVMLFGVLATACRHVEQQEHTRLGRRAHRSRRPQCGRDTWPRPEDQWPAQGTGAGSTTYAYRLNVNVYEPLVYLARTSR